MRKYCHKKQKQLSQDSKNKNNLHFQHSALNHRFWVHICSYLVVIKKPENQTNKILKAVCLPVYNLCHLD